MQMNRSTLDTHRLVTGTRKKGEKPQRVLVKPAGIICRVSDGTVTDRTGGMIGQTAEFPEACMQEYEGVDSSVIAVCFIS